MSPIKGLSEQRRLPRLGKIRLGFKVPNKSGNGDHPFGTDYFVLPKELKSHFPEKPTELPIMIPVEDDEIWCNQYFKRYSSYRGLTCKGDGETCWRMIDTVTGAIANRDTKEIVWKKDLTCEGKLCPDYISEDCKECMNLQFIMPDLPGLGIWQIDTSSVISIKNINSGAALVRSIYKRITFIPLLLSIVPTETIDRQGKKKTVFVLNLTTRETMRQLMTQANRPITDLLVPPPTEDEPPMDVPAENGEPEKKGATATGEEPPMSDEELESLAGETDGKEPVKQDEVEGSDTWILSKIVRMGIPDAAILDTLTTRYKIPADKLNKTVLGDNFKLLSKANRADLVKLLKAKEKLVEDELNKKAKEAIK